MILVSCDFHSRSQQIASVATETGDWVEKRLEHENGEARVLPCSPCSGSHRRRSDGQPAVVQPLLTELGHALPVGDAAKIRAMIVRRQKTHARDASHLLD